MNEQLNNQINNNEIPDFESVGYGDKKCLMTFYSLIDPDIIYYTFYQKDNIWQVYLKNDDTKFLLYSSPSLFDACSKIILRLKNEELANRFFNALRYFIEEEEVEKFITKLKTKYQKDSGIKLVLKPDNQ